MKKLLMAVAVMCSFAMAQTGSTSSDASAKTEKSEHKAHAKHEASSSDSKEKSITGCLHKDGDNMWLKTRMGKYHVMSKDDLSAHDGHEVKITGTTSKGPLGDAKDVKHLEASNVDMVSDTCKMGTKSMHMKGDEMSKEGDASKSKK